MTLTYEARKGGLIVAGHDHDPTALLAEGRQWLQDHAGMTLLDAFKTLLDVTSIQEAWWGDDKRGFVQKHHKGATAITVLNLPQAADPDDPDSPGLRVKAAP